MNEFVVFAGAPEAIWNSLILIGLTLRAFMIAVSVCIAPPFVHLAVPTRSPLNTAVPDVILNGTTTRAPGAIGPAIVAAALVESATTDVHPFGVVILTSTPVTGAPVMFLNQTVASRDDPGENVCNIGV